MTRPPVPPFTAESAAEKVRLAEDAWNTRDPAVVVRDYTPDSHWRQRAEFIAGRDEIEALLARKWAHELEYRLIRELFVFGGNRIAARFTYEYHDDSGHWFRAYGIETWQFDDAGYMDQRITSVNEHMIAETQRKLLWPLGRRPDDHPTLSELGL